MASVSTFRKLALSFPETAEQPHFERTSFRTRKKIFATLDEKKAIATLKLSLTDQQLYHNIDGNAVYPVPNKWGARGWTFFELETLSEELLQDALEAAYREIR